jgi:hypothetical protein
MGNVFLLSCKVLGRDGRVVRFYFVVFMNGICRNIFKEIKIYLENLILI